MFIFRFFSQGAYYFLHVININMQQKKGAPCIFTFHENQKPPSQYSPFRFSQSHLLSTQLKTFSLSIHTFLKANTENRGSLASLSTFSSSRTIDPQIFGYDLICFFSRRAKLSRTGFASPISLRRTRERTRIKGNRIKEEAKMFSRIPFEVFEISVFE